MTVLEVLQSTTAYFQKRDDRKSALERRASDRAFVRLKTNRTLSRVRTRSSRKRTGASARTRPAARPGRTAPTLLGTVEFCRPDFSLRQTRTDSAAGNRTTGRAVIANSQLPKRAIARRRHRQWSDCAYSRRAFSGSAELRPSIFRRTRSRSREKMRNGSVSGRVRFAQSDLLGRRRRRIRSHRRQSALCRGDGARVHFPARCCTIPEIALYAGEAGDELIRELIEAAPHHLRPGGLLALEIGIDQERLVARFLAAEKLPRHFARKKIMQE